MRNSSFAFWAVENSVHAVIPKKVAGARARSDTAFDMIESPRLFRKYFRLIRILETGVRCFLLPHISIRRYAAAKVSGAAVITLRIVIIRAAASWILLLPLKSSAGCICPK